MTNKIAYRIDDLVETGPFGRTFLFEAIRDGKLVARKAGRATVILASDWQAFIDGLPTITRRRAA